MTQDNGQGKELIAAVLRGDNAEVLRKMARALAPREPEKQIEALAYLHVDLAATRAALKAELAEIMQAAAPIRNKLAGMDKVEQWADETILATMVDRGVKKVDMAHATITLMPGKESMAVVDLDVVPDEYAQYKKGGNKRKAMRCLRETGLVPPGFDFVRGDPYIMKRAKK